MNLNEKCDNKLYIDFFRIKLSREMKKTNCDNYDNYDRCDACDTGIEIGTTTPATHPTLTTCDE